MTHLQAILIILQSFQPYYGDNETVVERNARLGIIASSIDTVSMYGACADEECDDRSWAQFTEGQEPADARLSMAAVLITIGKFESGYAKHVHENRCRVKLGECDGGRAKSPWQFQPTKLVRNHWYNYQGADQDSTDAGAYGALISISNAYKNCETWRGAIAQYATGGSCTWKHQQVRYDNFLKVKAKLAELLQQDLEDEDDDDEE